MTNEPQKVVVKDDGDEDQAAAIHIRRLHLQCDNADRSDAPSLPEDFVDNDHDGLG